MINKEDEKRVKTMCRMMDKIVKQESENRNREIPSGMFKDESLFSSCCTTKKTRAIIQTSNERGRRNMQHQKQPPVPAGGCCVWADSACCGLPVQPLADIVCDYASHDGDHERDNNTGHADTPFPVVTWDQALPAPQMRV